MIYDDGLEKMMSDGGFTLSDFLNLLCTKVGLNSILYYMSLFRSLACRCASLNCPTLAGWAHIRGCAAFPKKIPENKESAARHRCLYTGKCCVCQSGWACSKVVWHFHFMDESFTYYAVQLS